MAHKITDPKDLKNYISFSIKKGKTYIDYEIKNIIPNVSGEKIYFTYTLNYDTEPAEITDKLLVELIGDIEKNYQLLTVDGDVLYFQRKPGTDGAGSGAGGGSRKSKRKARKSRRSKAKKSRRRTRK